MSATPVPPHAYRLIILVKPCRPEELLELERALHATGGRIARRTPEMGHLHLAVDYPLGDLLQPDRQGQPHPAQGVIERFADIIADWMPGGR